MKLLRVFRERQVFSAYWRAMLYRDQDGRPGIGFEWRLSQGVSPRLVMVWSYADLDRMIEQQAWPAITSRLFEAFGDELQASINEYWAREIAEELGEAQSGATG